MDCIRYIYTRSFVKVQIIHILLRETDRGETERDNSKHKETYFSSDFMEQHTVWLVLFMIIYSFIILSLYHYEVINISVVKPYDIMSLQTKIIVL